MASAALENAKRLLPLRPFRFAPATTFFTAAAGGSEFKHLTHSHEARR